MAIRADETFFLAKKCPRGWPRRYRPRFTLVDRMETVVEGDVCA